MLHAPAEFPHPGSIAYLTPTALKVRILQHKSADQVLVSVPEQRCCNPAETSFQPRTVNRADLYPDGEAAMLAGKPARRQRGRKARG